MTQFKILGAAAIVTSLLASPAMAQQVYRDHDGRWKNSYNRWDDRDRGFAPAEIAAGVVGGAIGTAAAIATAPTGGEEYARRNGFVCILGTWLRGEDVRMYLPAKRHIEMQKAAERRANSRESWLWVLAFAGKSGIRAA